MELTTATSTEFDEFLSARNLTVTEEEKPFLLVKSFDFLSTLEFCAETGETAKAQCFIAYGMASGFDPVALAADKTLVKKGLGRSAIAKEWSVNDDLTGTDAVTMLKRLPMAYALLKPLLCQGATGGISSFEIIR